MKRKKLFLTVSAVVIAAFISQKICYKLYRRRIVCSGNYAAMTKDEIYELLAHYHISDII